MVLIEYFFPFFCEKPVVNSAENSNIKKDLDHLILYPNPTEEFSSFEFTVKDDTFLKIEIHNMNGVLINTLYNSRVKKGKNRLTFNIANLKSGVYFIKFIKDGDTLFTKKLIKQ